MAAIPDTEQNDPMTEYIYHPGEKFCPDQNQEFDADNYMDRLMQRRKEILANSAALHILRTKKLICRMRSAAARSRKKAILLKQTAKVSLLRNMEIRRLR
ncbi:MAG TPA: hypothetical protein O0X39_07485 [Methanocorpusculum sp.]|nr:hypothetical protein [Methanocorpusculum sp.]